MTEVITFSDTSIKVANGIHDHTNSSGTAGYFITASGDGSWSWQHPKITITDFSGSQTGNVIIGHEAANYGNTESDNVIIGVQAAYNAPDALGANAHIAIGSYAQYNGGYKDYSIAIGHACGYENQGQDSIAIGQQAGTYSLKDNSIAIGFYAGYFNSGTSETIYLGYRAGINGSGSKSILIGGYTSASSTSATDEIVIGHSAVGQGSNTTSLGVKDTDRTLYIGRGIVGNVGFSDHFAFAHKDYANISNYALIQTPAGRTIVNTSTTAGSQRLACNNSSRIIINNNNVTFVRNLTMANGDIIANKFSLSNLLSLKLRPGLRGRKYVNYYSDNFSFFNTAVVFSTGGKAWDYMYQQINQGSQGDYYSFKWEGFYDAPFTGTHYFRTTSDDASHVVVNGTTVVNNGGTHGSQTVQGSISLNSGTVNKIEIYFGEAAGGDNMKFEHYNNFAWTVDLHRYFRG